MKDKLYYFPAYEMVTQYFVDPFREDNRHLAPIVPGTVIATFVRHYCQGDVAATTASTEAIDDAPGGKVHGRVMRHAAASVDDARSRELLARVAELEEDLADLQSTCEARQQVIDGLKRAADERLALIERLDAELKARGDAK